MGSAVVQIPEKSGLPSAIRGTGADMFTLPSAFRGAPGVDTFNHCAVNGIDVKGVPSMISATAGVVGSVPGCEGLSVDLDALWALVEGLEKTDG